MIASAYPEANRLAYRIRAAITGESNGLETAKLAWQQAEAVTRANADLKRALQALADGTLLDCLLIENAHPRLLETARSLDHTFVEAWKTRCETYGWRVADPVDAESVSKIQSAIDEQGDLKDWLFKQYRTAIRSKKQQIRAYQIIELIADRYPDDPNAKEEAAAKRAQLVETAAAEIKDIHEQLIPTETATETAHRYLSLGLPLAESTNALLAETLAAGTAAHHKTLADKVHALVESAKELAETADWQSIENTYLDCDYIIAIHEARGQLETELRAELEQVATKLSRLRSKHESSISIRLAIAEIRNGKTNIGKAVPIANRVAKLKSLETQATKTGNQIPADLQEEIKSAYAYARRKKLPFYGAIAALLAIGIFTATYFVQQNNKRENEAALQSEALAALQATEQSGQTDQVRNSLETWSAAITQAEPNSSLANQGELLTDWLDLQSSLETEYTSSVADLAKLASSPDALQNEAAIDRIAADIRKTRTNLAPDLGQEAETRFNVLLAQFEANKSAALEKDRQEIARVERELRIAANNATQAKTRAEFERLQNAAESRIQTLNTLLQSDSAATSRSQLAPLIQSSTQQLAAIETKWAALDDAWLRLAETKELTPYLNQLERIHSFDILPTDQKTAISQTLRLKSAFADLRNSQSLFAHSEAEKAFIKGQNYLQTQAELTEEERAYLTRLQNPEAFANVYQSTVQYFEGSADPQSEYRIYLVEPISKSDSQQNESHVAFTFRVRGFDELGKPEPAPRDIQFISRDDGSFWGFFYKPSTLSPESEYYNSTIANTISHLLGGADRLAVLKQLESLEQQDQLSPAFRVYWQQQFISFMELHPWKWGLALSPALKKRVAQLDALAVGETSQTLWLSTIEQTVPSSEYRLLVEQKLETLPQKEVAAIAELYQSAANGDYQLAGYVLSNGKADLLQDLDSATPLWTVNSLTGAIDRLKPDQSLTPYAPILRFALEGGDTAAQQLRKATFSSGLKLAEPPYSSLLPVLYR
ncbi:hypothetical protein VDG1235_3681 [Verrucomicrobiia bacterium DG1235]|nr:hypothetical protein VDG1235_3681 [Verrucomicrobiae bacterium DG1235]